MDLTAYRDSDYPDESNDRWSISGAVVTHGGVAGSSASSTQSCVTMSTTEAEYVALGEELKETLSTRAAL